MGEELGNYVHQNSGERQLPALRSQNDSVCVCVSRNSGERPAQRSFFHGHEIPVCPSRNDGVCVTKFRTSSADGPRAHPGPSEIARDWGRDCNLATRSLQPSTPPPCRKPTGSFNCCVHAYHRCDSCFHHRTRLLCRCALSSAACA